MKKIIWIYGGRGAGKTWLADRLARIIDDAVVFDNESRDSETAIVSAVKESGESSKVIVVSQEAPFEGVKPYLSKTIHINLH